MKQQQAPNQDTEDTVTGKSRATLKEKLDQRLVDLYDLAKLFKVTRGTIYNWMGKGLISFITLGGKRYFDLNDIEDMLQEYKQTLVPGKQQQKKKKKK